MRVGEISDNIYNRLDPEISIKVTVSNIPFCVDNTLLHFGFGKLNDFNIRFNGAAPELDTITPNWTYYLLV
jgi:hypothetical protein